MGQSPGSEEERRGEPFVGPAGELLQEVVEEVGLVWAQVRRTNVFKRRLYEKDPHAIQRMIDLRARADLIDELRACSAARVIVTLGNEAMYALTGRWGITAFRGRPMYSSHLGDGGPIIIPTIHPSAILRSGQRGDGRSQWRNWLVADLTKARRILER